MHTGTNTRDVCDPLQRGAHEGFLGNDFKMSRRDCCVFSRCVVCDGRCLWFEPSGTSTCLRWWTPPDETAPLRLECCYQADDVEIRVFRTIGEVRLLQTDLAASFLSGVLATSWTCYASTSPAFGASSSHGVWPRVALVLLFVFCAVHFYCTCKWLCVCISISSSKFPCHCYNRKNKCVSIITFDRRCHIDFYFDVAISNISFYEWGSKKYLSEF